MSPRTRLPGHCPPEGHFEALGTFYRFSAPSLTVGAVVPESHWCLPIHVKKSEGYQQWSRCDAYAYSIFDSVDPLLEARRFLAWAKAKSICQINLVSAMGRLLETPSVVGPGHHDWYPQPLGLAPNAVVIEERP